MIWCRRKKSSLKEWHALKNGWDAKTLCGYPIAGVQWEYLTNPSGERCGTCQEQAVKESPWLQERVG